MSAFGGKADIRHGRHSQSQFLFIRALSASGGRDGERAADPLHGAWINAKTLGGPPRHSE
jgi:hypothetical protein